MARGGGGGFGRGGGGGFGGGGGGRGFGGPRGGRGGGGRGGRGGGREAEPDPPETLELIGTFMNAAEGDLVYKVTIPEVVPRFNAFVYTENKAKIGKIDEVMGSTTDVMFSVKPVPGVQAGSISEGDSIFVSPTQITPMRIFTDPPKPRGRGGRGGGGRGGRGANGGGGGRGNFGGGGGGNFGGGGRGNFGGGGRGNFGGGGRGNFGGGGRGNFGGGGRGNFGGGGRGNFGGGGRGRGRGY
ncbi:snoRNP protein GAR1 [Trypanosoma rangeli]|uniref:H/ACA ribonucleoprotein complex subunit n=1 Tax=Trypanosoma rangeli TaxID=5698 RepID=A0A422N4Z9_TRYRA|nr:snoRNP protein GAR1 [Trypanosoma rangeli]RNF00511.1 snoRNP protein GAR1 [Trypanosoma rangeli]|eukprot:RNF00511.1 snoRNP protein GAR1 [Trypanosoma rangeli]